MIVDAISSSHTSQNGQQDFVKYRDTLSGKGHAEVE